MDAVVSTLAVDVVYLLPELLIAILPIFKDDGSITAYASAPMPFPEMEILGSISYLSFSDGIGLNDVPVARVILLTPVLRNGVVFDCFNLPRQQIR